MNKLNHIVETALYVHDIDAAREFYVGILGLEVLKDDSKTKRDLFLRCGNVGLFLFDLEQTEVSTGKVPVHGASGAGHLAFSIPDSDFDGWREHLIKNGVAIETEVDWEQKGTHSIYFRDPSGNSLEFISDRHWDRV